MVEDATTPTVVIVGAGCAGTLTAIGLLRAAAGPVRVVLVERSGRFGPGVAYGTEDERHVLNVAAERMSAFPDAPDHFAAWARRADADLAPGAFLPRVRYGRYLRELLDAAEHAAPSGRCLVRVRGAAVAVEPSTCGARVTLADGRALRADHVVLALGSPTGPPPVALPDDPRVVANPWAPGALDGPPPATALLIGSGLTAVDVALTLCGRDPRARVVAVSRGGCLPFDQLPGPRTPVPAPPPPAAPTTVERLERWLHVHVARSRRAGHDWRDVLDGVRPHTQGLWRSLPEEERRHFLRTRARAWELRRHRMAPEIAGRVRALLASGRLLVRAARVLAVRALPDHLEVPVAAAALQVRTLRADRVVVCTGPGMDVRRTTSPLLRALLARGLATPDPLALGVRATDAGAVIGADGRARPWLHVLGPLRRGELWETTAVGEIRVQAKALAASIADELARATGAAGSHAGTD